MTLPIRMLLAAAVIGALHAGVYWVDGALTPTPVTLAQPAFSDWPDSLSDPDSHETWSSEIAPVPTTGDYEEIISRTYKNPLGKQVGLLMGLWTKYTVVVPHSPDVCYRCTGWETLSSHDVTLERSGHPIAARLMTLEKNSERIQVLYWYRFGERTIFENQDLRTYQQQMRGRVAKLPVALKVMLQTGITSFADVSQVDPHLARFAELVEAESERIESKLRAAESQL